MFKRTVLALAIALPSLGLVACGDNKHAAVTPKQKVEQSKENIEQMNILSDELLAEGFTLYPAADFLNFATETVGKVIVEVSGSEKLTRVQGKLEKYIELAKETLEYDDSSKVEVPDADKIRTGLENAQAYNEAINKETAQQREAQAKEQK